MRAVVALGFAVMISLCVPAGAATRHHARPRHAVVVHRNDDLGVPPGWYKFPGYPPIPPEQNRNLDPSNFGGG
jgi:hypothetical protein